ncbi:MAG: hypothetical protein IPH53_16475 [Flavobacteriales bacterium]|nr:hypothetical protein [Flavobacteriales bacterium]
MSLSRIIEAAENHFNAYQKDCSGYLKKVAGDLFIDLRTTTPMACTIYGSPGENLGKGQQVTWPLVRAESGHAHVAIIVGVEKDGTPLGYWGSIVGIGKKNARLTNSWAKKKFADISYYATWACWF